MRVLEDFELAGVRGGDGVFGSAADVRAQAGQYYAILNSVVSRTSNLLTNLPQSGNYSGNGVNDSWNKIEAWNEQYHIDPSRDFATQHSPANLD